jgi:hypothetical protein
MFFCLDAKEPKNQGCLKWLKNGYTTLQKIAIHQPIFLLRAG